MKNIKNLESKLKNSIGTNKLKLRTLPMNEPSKVNVKYEKSGKRKMTFYISQKCEGMINQIFASKMMMGEKVDKSLLICQAIEAMFRDIKKDLI